jgi:NAD(P)-dependent dehydrogenase (short-subunit alcohol dehydrogenase family)
MSDDRILVTGASRGIGLEFVRQYAEAGATVVACARNPRAAQELNDLAGQLGDRVEVQPLDVADGRSIAALAKTLDSRPIDLLINNAGAFGGDRQGVGDMDYEAWAECLAINTLGPFRVTEALLDNLAAGRRKTVATLSSTLGSIEQSGSGYAIYRSSKAAANMAMRVLSDEVQGRGIGSVLLHPGWVRTAMGGANAAISAEESVRGLRAVIDRVKPGQKAQFLDYRGQSMPW